MKGLLWIEEYTRHLHVLILISALVQLLLHLGLINPFALH